MIREPEKHTVTTKNGYNPSALTAGGIKVYTIKDDLIKVGITKAKTPYGYEVTVYNAERTVCDIFRSRSTIEMQVYQDAIKNYVRRKD